MDTEIYDTTEAENLGAGDLIRDEGHDFRVLSVDDDVDMVYVHVEPLDGVEDDDELAFYPGQRVPLVRYN